VPVLQTFRVEIAFGILALLGGAKIVPSRKMFASAGQNHNLDIVIGGRLFEGLIKLLQQNGRLGVAVTRPVERNSTDPIDLFHQQMSESHDVFSTTELQSSDYRAQ
jgi:hypothetical protein